MDAGIAFLWLQLRAPDRAPSDMPFGIVRAAWPEHYPAMAWHDALATGKRGSCLRADQLAQPIRYELLPALARLTAFAMRVHSDWSRGLRFRDGALDPVLLFDWLMLRWDGRRVTPSADMFDV